MLATAIILAEGDSSGWSVTEMASQAFSLMATAGQAIMANPVPAVFVGISIAASAIGLFRILVHIR